MHSRNRANSKARSKILIADGEGVFRLGLKKLFSVEDDFRVVAQAENSLQLVAMARSFRPDIALVQQDLVLNGCQGVLGQLHRVSPSCLVVITASHMTDAERQILIRDGVSGVIPRSAAPEAYLADVRKVLNGEVIHPPQEDRRDGLVSSSGHPHSRPIDTLTPREKTIISCLTQGLRNRDIADHLTITEQTVKNHLRSIYDKVGVSDRLELVLYAIHQRLELPPVDLYN